MAKKCKISGCESPRHSRDYCSLHYQRLKSNGDPLISRTDRWSGRTMYLPEYSVWRAIITRCEYKNLKQYKDYGGRGIRVCDLWRGSFVDFLWDMGTCPSAAHQIDRIDNDGDYCKENCRWVLPEENSQNRRSNILTKDIVNEIRSIKGKTNREISREYGLTDGHVHLILKRKIWRNI